MSSAQPTVLLVDDSAAIRSILKLFLSPLGVRTIEADRGDRALQALRLMPVSLVIADVNMPGLNGVEFVRAVRAHEREELRRIPIVLLTAAVEPELREAGLGAGADLFLSKPIDGARMTAAVRHWLTPRLAA